MMKSNQFAISLLAAAVIASPAFAEPISNTSSDQDGGVASEVVLRDNMWLNPALINTTPRQISVHSNNAGGVVTDVFGQRIGTHVRPGQTDLFWGMGLDGMLIGARVGIAIDNASSLPGLNFEGQPLYDAPFDNGTDIITVTQVSEFILAKNQLDAPAPL